MAAAALHSVTIPDPVIVPLDYVGEGPGLGAVNLVARQLPPQKPNAVLEQGVGRTPGVTDWERRVHVVHDNPDWSLGVGALFQPADTSGGGGGGPSVQTPIPIPTQIALQYIQNREGMSAPGSRTQDRTVPAMPTLTNSQRALL